MAEFGMMTALACALVGGAAIVIGIAIGRATGGDRVRVARLEAELAQMKEQLEEGVERLREEKERQASYQSNVVGHFARTSQLLKDLTLQYRSIYDHLADGARDLCPEGSLALEAERARDALLTGAMADESLQSAGPATDETPAASPSAPSSSEPDPAAEPEEDEYDFTGSSLGASLGASRGGSSEVEPLDEPADEATTGSRRRAPDEDEPIDGDRLVDGARGNHASA